MQGIWKVESKFQFGLGHYRNHCKIIQVILLCLGLCINQSIVLHFSFQVIIQIHLCHALPGCLIKLTVITGGLNARRMIMFFNRLTATWKWLIGTISKYGAVTCNVHEFLTDYMTGAVHLKLLNISLNAFLALIFFETRLVSLGKNFRYCLQISKAVIFVIAEVT